ncbi:aldehyde dehydrogenase family protein [Antarcticibacterium sp. 1MA-6-2]|uniref:aldehyde dehydrogenase family protein n=1 Tax=Antarcticibacterium sp. 1MA-6-2 TaxID=2908210 RepID=UPI001F43C6F0|nr:aldehyde dehydrogenase family protein [Antarcticibacterium sp. 1MA-6-2]UJH92143.1 aldehyde dehydrogenase family protein [Antarcticibacterium sp. 1MA-6-2]
MRFGGKIKKEELYIEPTIVDQITPEDVLMQEEIFGPILPVMEYTEIDEAINFINSREKPLALYYFGKGNAGEILKKTSSGGAALNDTLMHITNHHLPFGGVGHSGQGNYHGKQSFLAFSHQRAVVKTPTWIDLPFKYAPFKYFKFVKRLL